MAIELSEKDMDNYLKESKKVKKQKQLSPLGLALELLGSLVAISFWVLLLLLLVAGSVGLWRFIFNV